MAETTAGAAPCMSDTTRISGLAKLAQSSCCSQSPLQLCFLHPAWRSCQNTEQRPPAFSSSSSMFMESCTGGVGCSRIGETAAAPASPVFTDCLSLPPDVDGGSTRRLEKLSDQTHGLEGCHLRSGTSQMSTNGCSSPIKASRRGLLQLLCAASQEAGDDFGRMCSYLHEGITLLSALARPRRVSEQ